MYWLRFVHLRLKGLLRKEHVEDEMDAELRFHIQMRTQENIRRGMTPERARRDAQRCFGNLDRIKDAAREIKGGGMLETLWQDLRYGTRMLWKRPGFTLVAVATLALGIGASTAIFSVVNAVLLRPLPYENPGQLVRLWVDRSGQRTEQNHFAPADVTDFRDQLTTFEAIGTFDVGGSSNLTGGTQPERVNKSEASPTVFTVLRANPIVGRTFLADEVEVGQSKVAIISEGLWKRRFGADPNLAGRTIQLDGESFTVVGVLPGSFKFPENVDLWVPFSFTAADWKNDRSHHYVEVVGRLKPGVTPDRAKAELETIVRRLRPHVPAERMKWGVTLIPLHEQLVGDVSPTLWILFGAVGLVLSIACVNVANLLLTRGATRQKEMTIRAALGAGRARIVRQLLTENLLLASIGGFAGALLAVWAIELLDVSFLGSLPRAEEVAVDGRVLVFTLAVTVVTGAVFGLTPALQTSNPNLVETLKEGGRYSSASRSGLWNLLVVSEIALSLLLLVGAGLLVKSLLRLQGVNAGFDPNNVLTMEVTLPKAQYPDSERQNAFVQQALRRIETLPGVSSAAATINLPLVRTWGIGYNLEGSAKSPGQVADWANVTPGYFRTMGTPVLTGRDFQDRDTTGATPVVIISDAMARKHFPNESPLGRHINVGGKREIVGVVADVRPRGLELDIKPQVYLPYAQKASPAGFLNFAIRTEQPPLDLAVAVEKEIRGLDEDLPVANVRTMEQVVSASIARQRLTTLLLGIFAVMAVVLAAIGIFGVISYSVAQRTHEVGIRMALGARRGDVLLMVIKQGMTLTGVGVAVGLAGALALTRVMSSLLYGVTATDPLTFITVAALLTVVALAACYVPARRATKVNPLVAIRHE